MDYLFLNTNQKKALQTTSSELYLATMFITQSDRCWYDKHYEEMKNLFTKGNDGFTDNLVSDYHMIS